MRKIENINVYLNSEAEKEKFVFECETIFNKKLLDISKRVIESDKFFTLVTGPSCSGKTTISKKIISEYEKIGKKVHIISIDNFFKDRNDDRNMIPNTKIDYDSIDALNFDLLENCVHNVKPNNEILVPEYDFLDQKVKKYNKICIDEKSVLLFEGIQVSYPQVMSLFEEEQSTGVFLSVEEDVIVNGIFFSKDDIRLSRRIVRDKKFRGANGEFTLYMWDGVRDNEEKNIFPNKNRFLLQMNSFVGYELFLLRDYIIDILSEIKKDSKYYIKANELVRKYRALNCSIDYKYIPRDSIYTEFLG